MLTVDRIKEIVSEIGKKYGIKNAYLFGSYAKGVANTESDVDIIIERGRIKTYDDYFDFHHELESTLKTDVDLVSIDGVNSNFYELIKMIGRFYMKHKDVSITQNSKNRNFG